MSRGVWGAEHGLFPATGPRPCRIHPPPHSLLRDLLVHPRSPGRRGGRFPPLPHSLTALCDQLTPASQAEAAPTHRRTHPPPPKARVAPRQPFAPGPPRLLCAPPPAARGTAACGAEPVLPGGQTPRGKGGPKDTLEPRAPHTSPAIRKAVGFQDNWCPLPTRATMLGGFAVTPQPASRFSQPLAVPPGHPKSSSPPYPPMCCCSRAPRGEEQQLGWSGAGWAPGWGPHARLWWGLVGAATRCWELLD